MLFSSLQAAVQNKPRVQDPLPWPEEQTVALTRLLWCLRLLLPTFTDTPEHAVCTVI